MANAFRTALNVSTGRYWWVLVVQSIANGGTAQILRVLRGRGPGHSYVDLSFSGSFEECRHFQVVNGGSADGVLLVDDATPVKMVQIGDEELGRENFEYVNSIDGDFAVSALRRAIDELAGEVDKKEFKILAHLPQIFFEIEMLRQNDLSGNKVFTRYADGVSRAWFFVNGEPYAAYKIAEHASNKGAEGCQITELVAFIKERYFLDSVNVEDVSLEIEELAKVVAGDAWLFRTDHLPVFSTLPNAAAIARIREAAVFRRTFKACIGVLLATLLVTLAFWGGVSWYATKSEIQIASFEKTVETRKELERIWEKIEMERAGTEAFLGHRSRTSSFLAIIVKDLPADSWITRWTVNHNFHSMQGYSASSEEISKFLAKLEQEKRLINVRLRTTEKTTFKRKPVVKFDLTAEVVP